MFNSNPSFIYWKIKKGRTNHINTYFRDSGGTLNTLMLNRISWDRTTGGLWIKIVQVEFHVSFLKMRTSGIRTSRDRTSGGPPVLSKSKSRRCVTYFCKSAKLFLSVWLAGINCWCPLRIPYLCETSLSHSFHIIFSS